MQHSSTNFYRQEACQILKAGDWRQDSLFTSSEVYEGRIGDREVILAISSVGEVHAKSTVNKILQSYDVGAVLSLGFSGGLLPEQRTGDLIVAHTTVSMPVTPKSKRSSGQQILRNGYLRSDRPLMNDALRVLDKIDLRHRCGVCITASNIVSHPDLKRHLGFATGALAVDRESFWVGLACRDRGVPFLAVRSIVDTMEHSIPPCVTHILSDIGYRTLLRKIPHLVRPRPIIAMVRLAYAAATARRSLTAFALELLNSQTRDVCEIDRLSDRGGVG